MISGQARSHTWERVCTTTEWMVFLATRENHHSKTLCVGVSDAFHSLDASLESIKAEAERWRRANSGLAVKEIGRVN